MNTFSTPGNKFDDGSHDAYPTCDGRVENKAQTDRNGHQYTLECTECPWTVPIDRPTATRDDAVVLTDGGTATRSPSGDTARDRLDRLQTDAARSVRAAIDADDRHPTADQFRTVLEQSDGRIAYVVQHRVGIEYLYLGADGEVHCRLRKSDGTQWPHETLETESAFASRAKSRFDVVARENVPAWVRGDA